MQETDLFTRTSGGHYALTDGLCPRPALSGAEAAAELPAGGAEGEGEPLGLHAQPAAAADRLPQAGEHVSQGRGTLPASLSSFTPSFTGL